MKRPREKHSHRELFRPKREELKEQCVSCPFKQGNEKEFGEVVNKLRVASGDKPLKGKALLQVTAFARFKIQDDVRTHGGDFFCHHTVYQKTMKSFSMDTARQCPGATKFYLSEGGTKNGR